MKTLTRNDSARLSTRTTIWTARATRGALGGACVALLGAGAGMASTMIHAGGASAASSNPSWAFAAPHAPAPILENGGANPVIAKPRVVPILYASDPLLSDLEAFHSKLGTSTYLPSGLAEYGVGKVTMLPPIVRSDAPPATIDDAAASAWLLSQIASGAAPAADGSTVYSLVFPSTTQVSAGALSFYSGVYPLCGSVSEATQTADGTSVPFVLTAPCAGAAISDRDFDTENEAYALVSAFTNPGWESVQALVDLSWSGSGWTQFVEPFVSSLCFAFQHEPGDETPTDLGYLVPRLWSDEAAQRGHDPCVDTTAHRSVYFNAAPDLDGISTDYGPMKGVIVPPGGEVTIPVRLFSDGPTEKWTLGAAEVTEALPDANNVLSFSFDQATGANGDVRYLTIHRAVTPDGSVTQRLGFEITSTRGTTVHEWFAVVGVQ